MVPAVMKTNASARADVLLWNVDKNLMNEAHVVFRNMRRCQHIFEMLTWFSSSIRQRVRWRSRKDGRRSSSYCQQSFMTSYLKYVIFTIDRFISKRTSENFVENQPMHRKKSFLQHFVTLFRKNHTTSSFNPVLNNLVGNHL